MTDDDLAIIATMNGDMDTKELAAEKLGISLTRYYQRARMLAFDPDVSLSHPRESAQFRRWLIARRQHR